MSNYVAGGIQVTCYCLGPSTLLVSFSSWDTSQQVRMKSQPVWIKCPVPADQSEVSSCWPATSPGQFSQHNVEGICTCGPLEWSVLKIDHFSEVVILTPPSSKSADFFCLALHQGASYRVWSTCLRYLQLGWSVWGVWWLYLGMSNFMPRSISQPDTGDQLGKSRQCRCPVPLLRLHEFVCACVWDEIIRKSFRCPLRSIWGIN